MDGRDWKNLNIDCIVEIFSRVEKDSLVFHIPLVCKWWYRASLDPMCWRNLIFPESDVYEPQPNPSMLRIRDQRHRSRFTAFIKFVVYRSQRCGSTFHVPTYFSDEEFEYVSIRCPGLKILNSSIIPNHGTLISKAIRNWKHLEVLSLKDHHMFYEILSQISIYCERFVELNCSSFNFGKKQASAVVDALPNIRKLSIKDCYLPRKSLVLILKGCKGLKVLDVSNCWGIIEDDQIQILHLASYIGTFKFKLCPMVPLPSRDVLWNEDFDPKQNQSEEKLQHGSDINSSELRNSKIKNFRKRSHWNIDYR